MNLEDGSAAGSAEDDALTTVVGGALAFTRRRRVEEFVRRVNALNGADAAWLLF